MFARLRGIADQLPQVPGIGKVEIAEGGIVLTPSPVDRHELPYRGSPGSPMPSFRTLTPATSPAAARTWRTPGRAG
ncbi:hypothetical protein GCM10018781_49590 [Kitasatospora indigofera]|uniref:Uncharacterized protein n=1 Tax=Kitasatospora indigofera TaxID=67307 RepID=A0A919G331_9ACTN|nr:hypothetical protein GCM10018781_49590 [Kitasatospora indigofera]